LNICNRSIGDLVNPIYELTRERADLEDQLQILYEEMIKSLSVVSYKEILLEAASNIDDLLANAEPNESLAGLNLLFPGGIPVRDGEIVL